MELKKIRIPNIVEYHKKVKEKGWPKIINLIVRKRNKIYFATRAQLGPFNLLRHLMEQPVDLPSFLLHTVLKTERERIEEKIERLKADRMKIRNTLQTKEMNDLYEAFSDYIDQIITK